jgi:hypothetical protein
MRWIALVGGLALLLTQAPELRARAEAWLGVESDPRVQAAIELRCPADSSFLRADCARELEQDFAAGRREPESIVRPHCTRFENDWALHAEPPLPICTELYGGWIKG